MPLTRYQIRSEYGLADPELYRAADKDDPEALLEGVAMAGLVGILRQLGDLAEFAAEMFHDLHEEVMATAARGHGLMIRVQQLEAEFPSVEKALLSRTDHSPFFSHTGMDWHPNVQLEQSLITRGDLPRCVMDSYEECRGPPRLFLLDKFDVAGAGACLKRYTDPSFFRLEISSPEASSTETQREKKSRKAKKRGSRWRNGGTPEIAPSSHAKLHELFLEERVQADPSRLVRLKTRKLDRYSLISKSGESYMEKFVQTCVDHKTGYEGVASSPELLTWNTDETRDSVTEIPEISMVDVVEKSFQGTETEVSTPNEQENEPKYNLNGDSIDKDIETVPVSSNVEEEVASTVSDNIVEKVLQRNLNGVPGHLQNRSYSEDLTSEVDNYVDAPATMESETETDDDVRPRDRSGAANVGKHDSDSDVDEEKMEDQPQFSDSQSVGNTSASENGRRSFLRWISSYSYSDAGSISTENDPSDKEKIAELLPSTGSCKSETVEFSSDVNRGNKDAQGSDSHEQELISDSDVDRQATCTLHVTSSSPRSVSQNVESPSSIVQSLAPEIVETPPESSEHDLQKGGDYETKKGKVDSTTSGTLLDVKDPSFFSGASLVVSAFEGNRDDIVTDDASETNCQVDYISESLGNSGPGSRPSDDNLADQQLPCSAGLRVEISPIDMNSKVGDSIAEDDIHSNNTLHDEVENATVTNVVPEARSQSAVSKLASEHSPEFGAPTDESVSESHEITLENRTPMPNEVDCKVTSDVISHDKKLLGDASPTSSACDEQLHDISAEPYSSYADDKGFHYHARRDNKATEIVPQEEFHASDNDADTALGDVNHVESICAPSSTFSPSSISEKTCVKPSGVQELSHDEVMESDRALSVECNHESERKMQTNPSGGASEDMDNVQHSSPVSLDDSDLANGKSIPLQTSEDQSNSESKTKSLPQSTLLDNCVDSALLDMDKPSETPIEQSVKVHDSSANHGLTDEAVLESDVWQGLSSEFVPQSASEANSSTQALNLESTFPKFGIIPETPPASLEEMPPLPPLPPMQWRLGKVQHFTSPSSSGESVENMKSPLSAAPVVSSSLNTQSRLSPSAQFVQPLSLGGGQSEQLPAEFVNNADDKASLSHLEFPMAVTDFNGQYDSSISQGTESVDPSVPLLTMANTELKQDCSSEESNIVADQAVCSDGSKVSIVVAGHAVQNHEFDEDWEPSLQQLHQDQSAAGEDLNDDMSEHISQSMEDADPNPDTEALTPKQSTEAEQEAQSVPCRLDGETAEPSSSYVQKILPSSLGDAMWPVNAFAVAPTLDTEKPNEIPTVKLPRPRSPLVDAVAAHDRRTMRKVSARIRQPTESEEEDKNSFLAQIRNKSFNLKPAAMTRPNIQAGPKTNLKVAAILEKANTIRQAMAGSDEDEDSDSWSDS